MKIDQNITISCTVPVRFDFGGGPTDVQPFPMETIGAVLNTSIDLYTTATLRIGNKIKGITLNSKDYSLSEHFASISDIDLSGSLSLIKACVKSIGPKFDFELMTRSDVPPGSGLGASAALTIAIIKAFKHFEDGQFYNLNEIIKKSIIIENSLAEKSSGGQDQYAAVLGGCNMLTFNKNIVEVKKININPIIKKYIEDNSILCFSGSSHNSSTILNKVMNNFSLGDIQTSQSLYALKKIAKVISESLESNNKKLFIDSINLSYKIQKKLHKSIINNNIEKIWNIGKDKGAIAIKVAGAGGGGFVFIVCENGRRSNVSKSLRESGYGVYQFRFLNELPNINVSQR
jgi:D-glycero-alpha-D-manno-heptose-7-phosphate kinase